MSEDMIHLLMGALMTAGGLIVSIMGWLLKGTISKIDRIDGKNADHDTRLAVIERSSMKERVDDHEVRLKVLEELKVDVRVLVKETQDIRRMLEAVLKGK